MPGWLSVKSPAWSASVRVMRISCPVVSAASFCVGLVALAHGPAWCVPVDFVCSGVTLMLTCVNWFVFRP